MNKRRRHLRRAGIAATLCLFLAGCQTQLYGNLPEREANAVLAALTNAAIVAEKRPGAEGTYAVFVDEADFGRAVGILDALALPGRKYDDLGTVFGKGAMFSTPMEEKARYLYAMQEELSQTVASIDGVLAARVHLVLPEQDQMGKEIQMPSAAVFVKHIDDERHDPLYQQREIRRLVAASVPSLSEERIVVTFFPVQPVREAPYRERIKTILGMRISEQSERQFWWIFGGAAGGCVLLGGLALAGWLRRGRK